MKILKFILPLLVLVSCNSKSDNGLTLQKNMLEREIRYFYEDISVYGKILNYGNTNEFLFSRAIFGLYSKFSNNNSNEIEYLRNLNELSYSIDSIYRIYVKKTLKHDGFDKHIYLLVPNKYEDLNYKELCVLLKTRNIIGILYDGLRIKQGLKNDKFRESLSLKKEINYRPLLFINRL